jgi:hypothetical protein
MLMNKLFQKYAGAVVISSILIILIAVIVHFVAPNVPLSPAFPYLILFFIISSLLIFRICQQIFKKKPTRTIPNFLALSFLKFFVYIILLLAYVFLNRPDAIPFLITFFILYVVFTAIETIFILRI